MEESQAKSCNAIHQLNVYSIYIPSLTTLHKLMRVNNNYKRKNTHRSKAVAQWNLKVRSISWGTQSVSLHFRSPRDLRGLILLVLIWKYTQQCCEKTFSFQVPIKPHCLIIKSSNAIVNYLKTAATPTGRKRRYYIKCNPFFKGFYRCMHFQKLKVLSVHLKPIQHNKPNTWVSPVYTQTNTSKN